MINANTYHLMLRPAQRVERLLGAQDDGLGRAAFDGFRRLSGDVIGGSAHH